MEIIKDTTDMVGETIGELLPDGWFKSLIVNGVIAGAGGVVVFLPQILILFFFILVLEESGYLPRAAYLLDRLMGSVGLSGRSFIPLLSSFAALFLASWPQERFQIREIEIRYYSYRTPNDLFRSTFPCIPC
jgi:Fe2+ transport system protein B